MTKAKKIVQKQKRKLAKLVSKAKTALGKEARKLKRRARRRR